ncbi:MAG: phenylalanine 4-monooxygenase [Polyangiaceae bacterium]|nr:phenylalanine 4-monooxygenase [Polyangiaceae bacterium]
MLGRELVALDQDHPGFRDPDYRARRNAIAAIALGYERGRPVPKVDYTAAEDGVWREVWAHLDPLHDRYACAAYLEGAAALGLDKTRVPQLADLNEVLGAATGFSMLPVGGLITPKIFMDHLDEKVFLATQYMRHHSRPLYTPEPDIVHEVVGHAPTLLQAGFVRLSRAFGVASKRADAHRIEHLIRLYWYTLEFGVVEEAGGLKVCGAGLLSSFGELGRFEKEARLLPLSIDRVIETPFDPTSYQGTLFVAPGFDRMIDDVEAWLLR